MRSKEIKVKIPVQQHLKLHTLKLTEGITITEAVETALKNYFDKADAELRNVDESGDQSSNRDSVV